MRTEINYINEDQIHDSIVLSDKCACSTSDLVIIFISRDLT